MMDEIKTFVFSEEISFIALLFDFVCAESMLMGDAVADAEWVA